ncbi:hypothetical protein SEA_TORTELLINI_46 [Mycobacterium phage Tortellini]|uniref:Uncharacterized protein n=1 Tax=Mycobacterium phage Tortellini TaxID=1897497 RepID=A0A1D8EX58_9CAUD|nr:hypothetical protein FDH05_gp46 [Mycobacterium phage Tortellini]AOT25791.1 hypothetical protein SEA_TORTELLINI_46 [Mycobacterium phage Tortellini]
MSRRIIHRTVHKRTARRTLALTGLGALAAAGIITATPAEALPGQCGGGPLVGFPTDNDPATPC